MTIYLYSNLEDLESQHGIDFSKYTKSWAPEDDVIYHATDKSFTSAAARLINDYCETTFSDFPDCDDIITHISNEIVLRMIRRRNAMIQALGHTSFGDDFLSVTVSPAQLRIKLLREEEDQLEQFRIQVVLAVVGE